MARKDKDSVIAAIAAIIRERFELGLDDGLAEGVAREIVSEVLPSQPNPDPPPDSDGTADFHRIK